MGNYEIKDLYGGGYSSLKPDYGNVFTGYRVAASSLGAPTKIDTANQIQQVHQLLNQGIVPIEVGVLQPEIFDQIPKQHFKEMKQVAKVAGAKISIHAPIIEPSGIGERGWSESNRELAERQLNEVINKSVEVDDKGGVPITIHSSGIPGAEYKITPEGKKIEKLIVINQETGQMAPLEEEKKFYPDTRKIKSEISSEDIEKLEKGEINEQEIYEQIPLEKGQILTPRQELNALNNTEWDNSLSQVVFYKEGADRILSENAEQIQHLMKSWNKGDITEETINKFPELKQALGHVQNAGVYLKNTEQYLSGLFNKAYKFGNPEEKRILERASQQYTDELKKASQDPVKQSNAIQNLIGNLKKVTPKLYVPVEEFAVNQSSETFANVAFNAFKKHKNKAPQINIENMYSGMAFALKKEGKEGVPGMRELISETKKKFVKKALEKGYSKSVAEEQADKMIGMTLDVGHLNIAKKKGFKDKDLIKEVKEIAKNVKHIHLTDNFGHSDSHLAPGMGNVPFKKILEELEKAGSLKDSRQIVEAPGFVQHFGTSPLINTLEGMGSPFYKEDTGLYWNQAIGLQEGYFSGYGQTLPQINYETFGAGFSQLPQELGGQRSGGQGSRMSGRPME